MSVQTKQRILDRLNGTNAVTELEAVGPIVTRTAAMPIHLVLKAIIEASGLKPGDNCEIADFLVKGDEVEIKYLEGKFQKVGGFIPDKFVELFGSGPVKEQDFED
jgi:hypothetical protein